MPVKSIEKLQEERLPILEARDKNRQGKYTKKMEDSCNAKLRKLNIAIQEAQTKAALP
jgi:hypothetical protein